MPSRSCRTPAGRTSTARTSSRRSPRTCGASTRAASSSTTRSRRCTRRCAARTPMPRSTGWCACSMAAPILSTSAGGWCAWRSRTSASPIRGRYASRSTRARFTSAAAVRKAIARRLATRGPRALDVDTFRRFEEARRNLQTAVEQAQASRNKIAKDIGQAKARGQDVSELLAQGEKLKQLLERSEEQLAKLQAGFQDFLGRIPNLPHESVPVGDSAEENREERRWGEPR